jgi:AraC-like DNA-binding protein
MIDSIKTYHFKAGLPLEFEIISLDNIFFEKNKAILTAPHRTDFYHIIWFQKGNPTHLVDFKPIILKPNSLLFIGKDQVHLFDKSGNFSGKLIVFTNSFFGLTENDIKYLQQNILFNDLLDVTRIDLGQASANFIDVFHQMEKELENPVDSYQPQLLKNYLHNFLLLAEREKRKQGFTELKKSADYDYVLLFRDILEQKFRHIKSVGNYASLIHVSEKRLSQATSRILGKSPKQLIDERVLLEAKRLLVHSSSSIKEIGYTLGFEEPTNFIKYFRKHIQKTPVEFRESYFNA